MSAAHNRLDLAGLRFGMLTMRAFAGYDGKHTYWHADCDCGKEKEVRTNDVRSGRVQSCGCYHGVALKQRVKHGMSQSRVYRIWADMKKRCQNPHHWAFSYYGGRGITVCDRWLVFENFIADMGTPPAGLTLDRIDNDKGYSLDNCRWATRAQQAKNRRPFKRKSK